MQMSEYHQSSSSSSNAKLHACWGCKVCVWRVETLIRGVLSIRKRGGGNPGKSEVYKVCTAENFSVFNICWLMHSGALVNLGINRDNGKWQICFLDYLSSIRLVAKLDSIVTCFLLVWRMSNNSWMRAGPSAKKILHCIFTKHTWFAIKRESLE